MRAAYRSRRSGRGSAVLIVILLSVLFSAIVLGAAAFVRVELLVGRRYAGTVAALHAAEGALDAAVSELRSVADWSPVVAGLVFSSRVGGVFRGAAQAPGAPPLQLCCGAGTIDGRLSAETLTAPLPARRAVRWRPFLWAPFDALAAGEVPSRVYVVVWIANDEGDPGGEAIDTNGLALVRVEALGGAGERRIIEALVGRQPEDGGLYSLAPPAPEARRVRVAVLTWREVR